jgi:hypothetical protein
MTSTLRTSALRTFTLAALCTTLLAGCAVMSKDDCLKADWRELGRRDASQGLTIERFTARADACRKNDLGADPAAYAAGHGDGQRAYCTGELGENDATLGKVSAPLCAPVPLGNAYQTGYAMGLIQFCTARNGYEFARLGGTYRNTCPADLAGPFQAGLRMGTELRELNSRLDGIQREATEQRKIVADDKSSADQRDTARRLLRQTDADEAATRRLIRQAELSALSF